MQQSKLFTKTSKNFPSDETSINAQLLIKAGFIHKEMAGAYAYLPLGLKVIEKIKQIVREEMAAIGGVEIIMTTLQRKELWEKTDRWDDEKVDVWFKSKLKNDVEVGFGWSHEEPISDMMRNFINSYRDLPVYVHQFQTKLRNELRAKSGIMRGREFIMDDMYSYSSSNEEHQKFYDAATAAYHKVFERLGIGEDTFFTFASGGAFTQFSHEFQTICDAGEDIVYLDRKKKLAINKEVYNDEVLKQLEVKKEDLKEVKTAEVGNIFSFGGAKSESLDLYFTDALGNKKPVILGSYGIGITRVMGVIVEKFHDDKGIIWPASVAPFHVHLIELPGAKNIKKIYDELQENNIEVLWDDRETGAGAKFADSDLIGIPVRLVVSEKTGEKIEYKERSSDKTELLSLQEVIKRLI
ncbi:MAG TPA: aminoacyl--tRNA ligase-related protein [Patescibacteria group bacterium]|nr:aminoacyl--tRNA ligase-related protein [Patescibacteria group bacterium]